MPWVDVIWTDENEAHIAVHGLDADDVEHVLRNAIESAVSESTGRPMVFGYTPDGRRIVVVYEQIDAITVYPITAYSVD